MGGAPVDWCQNNVYRLIDWYKEFVEKNPGLRNGYQWLLNQLINTGRVEEAKTYLERMEKVDGTFRTPLYRGHLAKASGSHAEALEIWEQMRLSSTVSPETASHSDASRAISSSRAATAPA
mgnify:CR=1 FL=1